VRSTESTSSYNLTINREVVVIGKPESEAMVRRVLSPLPFLLVQDARTLVNRRESLHFIVAALDFTDVRAMQAVARSFSSLTSPLSHLVILASAPLELKREHLLFAVEIGARHTSWGPQREEDLRSHLKRVCKEALESDSTAAFSAEISEAAQRGDRSAMRAICDRLVATGRNSEDVLRLLVCVNGHLGRPQREEFYLKKVLSINPQNLWAANELGKFYLRRRRAGEGIEVLRRLSHFHDLNAERLHELGNAWLHAGRPQEAAKNFTLGSELTGGTDERFRDGLVKAKMAEGDSAGALSILGKPSFSIDVLSFLNMRAIMSIRAGKIEDGLACYKQATDGFKDGDPVVLAKIKFNHGLGFVKAGQPDKAVELFEESALLGGDTFQRAAKPLEIARTIVARGKSGDKAKTARIAGKKTADGLVYGEADLQFDDLDYEKID